MLFLKKKKIILRVGDVSSKGRAAGEITESPSESGRLSPAVGLHGGAVGIGGVGRRGGLTRKHKQQPDRRFVSTSKRRTCPEPSEQCPPKKADLVQSQPVPSLNSSFSFPNLSE